MGYCGKFFNTGIIKIIIIIKIKATNLNITTGKTAEHGAGKTQDPG